MIRLFPSALLAVLALLSSGPRAAPEDELLEPDQAFALSTRVVNAETIEAGWKIAPGYYMYRDKFKFEVIGGDVAVRPAVFPPGKKKQDPLFGLVETYTKSVTVQLPLARRQTGAQSMRLRITAQGCNEPIGVCYSPIVKEVTFALPAGAARLADEIIALKSQTGGGIESGDEEAVDPEKAFAVRVGAAGDNNLAVRFDIADCCYLYRDKTRFELTAPDGGPAPAGLRLGAYRLPPGKAHTDEFFGKTEVYYRGFEAGLPMAGPGAREADLLLKVMYQGCAEKGVAICYAPMTRTYRIGWRQGALVVGAEIPAGAASDAPAASSGTTGNSRRFLLAMLAAFGTGLLLTFTPCVLPMIPILSSVVVGATDGQRITKLRGGLLSASYVLGTAVTYTVAGAMAGATGEQLQAYFQNPWALGLFGALFVALALSMFGFYELHMPAFIQSFLHHHGDRLHRHSRRIPGGVFFGVFLVGLLSALVIGACVSPLLITALSAAIASRDPWLGGAIMFSMALGMGAILIGIGVGAGFLLPKAGAWMDRVKHVFGVLLIAVAIYLLGFIPEVPVLLLWSALLFVSAIYLGATESLPHGTSGWRYLWKGVGTLLLAWGALALIGGLRGNRDLLNPLPLSTSGGEPTIGTPVAPAERLFTRVQTLRELEDRLAAAGTGAKPVVLDYYADWCVDCLRMEQSTFADARVRAELRRRFVLLQADVTNPNDPEVKAMKRRFDVYGPPAMLFFAPDGKERRDLRTYGYRSAEKFLVLLNQV